MYLISVLTLLLWHSFCFFLLWSLHTSWVLLLLICHTFILSSLIFCPYYLYPAQLYSTPSSFSWCGIFVLKSEIQYTNFDSLLSQDCFSTTRTLLSVCTHPWVGFCSTCLQFQWLFSSFPAAFTVGKAWESGHLKLWESLLLSLCFSLDCFWFHRDPVADITVMVVHPHLFIFWSSWGYRIA